LPHRHHGLFFFFDFFFLNDCHGIILNLLLLLVQWLDEGLRQWSGLY
jgi:hypothetical protein